MSGLTANTTTDSSVIPTSLAPEAALSDPKVIAAYVCFGVGAFIIILAVIIIVVFLCVRRRREKKKRQLRRSLCLDDYKFPGSGYQLPISTISDKECSTRVDVPDYNFTGNGYHFPLTSIPDDIGLSQRHHQDDGTLVLSIFNPQSTDSLTPYSSRSSGEFSGTESRLGEAEGYVRLHRSSPLAGINAIYSSSGELSSDQSWPSDRRLGTAEPQRPVPKVKDINRRSSLRRVSTIQGTKLSARDPRTQGNINEGFIADDHYDTPNVFMRNSSSRTSLERINRDKIPPKRPSSSQNSSVLLGSSHSNGGVYHVSLRHDGSVVTQTRVVKHPT